MTNISNLVVFAENGEKDITGLNQTNGFPAALKPARQWFNFLFNSLTAKINEVIERVNNNSTALEGITDYFLPIGTIISSFDSDFNPNTKYPGTTWILHGEGRVGVGLSTQVGDPEWKKTVGNIFGSDTHTLTINEMPSHSHTIGYSTNETGAGTIDGSSNGVSGFNDTGSMGNGEAHNNVQPSVVEARWRRTA